MSTNNNHSSRSEKETKPRWKCEEDGTSRFGRLSSSKVQERMSNDLSECNAVTLSERGIKEIVDLSKFSGKLRRLDLSKNKLGRLACFQTLSGLSMLNVSENELQGDSSLDELRYLTELRTLNISNNPKIKGLRSKIIKPISKLQALIATQCGLSKLGFLRHCQELNTLVLSKNLICNWMPSEVGALEKLQKISLGYNQLKAVPDLHLCVSLTEIRLNSNAIEEVDDRFVRFASSRIKTLDLSANSISKWEQVEKLKAISTLTNLGIKGNPLPTPPISKQELGKTLKEDYALAAGKVESEEEQHIRQYVLVMFQRQVGKEKKTFEQLIVLDQKRVKVKWTQGGAGQIAMTTSANKRAREGGDNGPDGSPGKKKKRGKKPELHSLGTVLSGGASEGGVGADKSVAIKKPAVVTKTMEVGQTESGVLAVDTVKKDDKKKKDKDKPKEERKGKKKSKGEKKGNEKEKEEESAATVSEGGEAAERPVDRTILSALSASSITNVGTGGESAWG